MRSYLIVFVITFSAIFGAAWYWSANGYMQFADSDYAVWAAKKMMLEDCNVGVLAIIGDSQAQAGIVPVKVGPGVVNFGLAGASPVTMLEVSRRILDCQPPPKAVLLSLSSDQFAGIDLFWKREVKYALFDIDLEEARRRARQFDDVTIFDPPAPFDFDMRLQEFLAQKKFPAYYFGSMLAGYVNRRGELNAGYLRDTLTDKGYHYFGKQTLGDNEIRRTAFQRSFAVSPFFGSYFEDMLKLYGERGVPVYFLSAPLKPRALRVMTPEFKEGYARYMEGLTETYSNFHILGDLFPELPPEAFNDASHLNVLGAVTWSTRARDLLMSIGVDTGAPFSLYGSH